MKNIMHQDNAPNHSLNVSLLSLYIYFFFADSAMSAVRNLNSAAQKW